MTEGLETRSGLQLPILADFNDEDFAVVVGQDGLLGRAPGVRVRNGGLRGDLSSVSGAAMVASDTGANVQEFIWSQRMPSVAALVASDLHVSIQRVAIEARAMCIWRRFGADPGPLWPAIAKVQDAGGDYWGIDPDVQEINASHFGYIREPWGTYGGPNEAEKLQAFVHFFFGVHIPLGVNANCEARWDGYIDFKHPTIPNGLCQTTNIRGIMKLRGGTYVTDRYSIEIHGISNYTQWSGGIQHGALGEATFNNRRNMGGIAVGYASRANIAFLFSTGSIADGVRIVMDATTADGDGIDNANLMQIGRIAGYSNGCGYDDPTFSHTNTVSQIDQYPDAAADVSLGQRSRISLGSFLPTWLLPAFNKYVGDLGAAGEAAVTRTDNFLVWIAGEGLRKITYADPDRATIWVQPKIRSSAVGAQMKFVRGGSYANEGSDSNVISVGMIETAVSGYSRSMGCPYGSYIGVLHSDGVGVADAYGSYTTGTCVEHVVGNFYTEAASFAEYSNSSIYTRINVLGGVGGHPATGKLRVANLHDPVRQDNGKRARQHPALPGCQVRINGKNYRDGKNVSRFLNNVTLYIGNDDENPRTISSNASVLTINIEPSMETFADCIDGWGCRTVEFIAMGATYGSAPPDMLFPAKPGWKYNGGAIGAALNWVAPTKMMLVHIFMNEEDQEFQISKLSFD